MDQQPIDLSASILAILQAIAAILGALAALGTVLAPIFPSFKNLDSKLRPAMERLGAINRSVEGFHLSIPFTRIVFKGKQPPAALLLLVLLLAPALVYADPPNPYRAMAPDTDGQIRVALVDNVPADTKAHPSEPTATNETPAPAKKIPTIAEVAACTLSSIPGVVTDCIIGGNYKGAAVDSRVFWTTLGVGAGNSLLAIGGFLAAHYWPVTNDTM